MERLGLFILHKKTEWMSLPDIKERCTSRFCWTPKVESLCRSTCGPIAHLVSSYNRDVKSPPNGGNPTFFTVDVKVGLCDSFKIAIKIIGGGGLGGYFGLSDNHRISCEILPRSRWPHAQCNQLSELHAWYTLYWVLLLVWCGASGNTLHWVLLLVYVWGLRQHTGDASD
jgi:hypothetical protein